MRLIEFEKMYPDEKTCREKFRDYRLQNGVTCKKCDSREHYWLPGKEQFQCKKCGFRTTLRSGTIMQYSKLPFRIWFIAMHLMTSTKKGFSAKEVQYQVAAKRYEPVWYMMQKIRGAMGERDKRYKLSFCVEIDEGFFETARKETEAKKRKRGRGSERQAKVLVMAESSPVGETKKGRPSVKCGFFKMVVIKDLEEDTIHREVKRNVKKNSIAVTDFYKSYYNLTDVVNSHVSVKTSKKNAGKALPWVHIAISNAKRNLLNTYHSIQEKYYQNYLNEFCYRLNRRYMKDMFGLLVNACASINYSSGK